MSSAAKAAASRGENAKLLKGSDLKKTELSVTVFCKAVREAPDNWGSPLVMDIEENHGCTALALNKTNTKLIANMIDDDTDNWVGYEITFEKVKVNNPSGGGLVDGLVADAAKKSKRKVPF